jgi:tetratricopeptide (TPR) repeat protein
MHAPATLRSRPMWFDAALIGAALVLTAPGARESASAQGMVVETAQSDLVRKSPAEQSAMLADIVRRTWKDRTCSGAKVSLEKAHDGGSGGWLVLCEEGQDYWVIMPAEAKKAATSLPCIMARISTGTECYANLRTALPEHVKQCRPSSGSLDRVIRSCSAIIQSHQFDDKPGTLLGAYVHRAAAYATYNQFDLAIVDLDQAVALQPGNIDARLNRAVTLARKGEFDLALSDLEKVIQAMPNDVNGLFERGNVWMKKAVYDRAISDFDTVLWINPGFDKAIRNRAEAVKAKEASSGQTGPKVAAIESASFPATREQQAAYCMEASLGYAGQLAKLVAALRDTRDEDQAHFAGLSPTDRAQATERVKTLNDDIAASETRRTAWNAHLKVFTGYLQGQGLLDRKRNPSLIQSMSGQVRSDQKSVQSIYWACLHDCALDDATCARTCNGKAGGSDAARRMLRCGDIADNFK